MNNEFFKSKGKLLFYYSENNEIVFITETYLEPERDCELIIVGDLMSGKDFYDEADRRCIINYDGTLGYVFVNGYESNLGLLHEGLCQGDFIIDGNTWLKLCDEFDIVVEWCNK